MSLSTTTASSVSARPSAHRQTSASRIPVRSPRKVLHRTSESSTNTQSADGPLVPTDSPSPSSSKTKSKSPTASPVRVAPPPRQLTFTPWRHASRLPVRTPKAPVSSSDNNEMAPSTSSDSLDSIEPDSPSSAYPMSTSPSGRDMTAALLELEQELPPDDEFLVVWRATSALSLGERNFH